MTRIAGKTRLDRWIVGTVLLTSGCYLTHGAADGREDAATDGNTSDHNDARTLDGSAADAGSDARTPEDAFWPFDSRPPEMPPPEPARCRTEPEIFPFTDPVMEARWPNGPMTHEAAVHVCATPVVIDLDPTDDDVNPAVIFPSYPSLRGEERGILRIWYPRENETISFPEDDSELGVLEPSTNLAAADIDGDGMVEIVGLGTFAGTYAFNHDGSLLWESPFPTARDRGERWERTIGGAISIADLEGDGEVEIIAGRNVLEGVSGDRRFTGSSETTTRGTNQFLGPIACVADLDGDGDQEVIAGPTAMHHDGSTYWRNEDLADGLCAVADIDDESPGPEVILAARGYLYILDGRSGDTLWVRVIEGRGTAAIGGAPTVADFDGDDRPEIGIAHGASYGVYDPECERSGRPAGCAANGLLWTAPTGDDSSSGTGSSVFDFNGDGRAEVVYNDQYFFRVYDGSTGRPLFEHRNSSRTRSENPAIVDVDNDGDAEIVFSANAEAFFIREFWTDPGVEIWGDRRGRWVGARRVWNQHAYHITNIEENGQVPRMEQPSWTVLNAYRQNLREDGDVLATPDLWGGHGDFECLADGGLRLIVEVQNWGLERVGAGVVVGFYRGRPSAGGERLGELRTSRTLESGGDSETLRFDTIYPGERADYYAVLDDVEDLEGGSVAECLESNNEVLIWRAECD